jgi:hypothetical protein
VFVGSPALCSAAILASWVGRVCHDFQRDFASVYRVFGVFGG